MPKADIAGLKPDVQSALDDLKQRIEAEHKRLQINSAYRSIQEQQRLWDNRANNPYPVAPPGQSRHQQGTAVDMRVPGMTQEQLAEMAAQSGFKWAGNKDRIHFDYKKTHADVAGGIGKLPQKDEFAERLSRLDDGTRQSAAPAVQPASRDEFADRLAGLDDGTNANVAPPQPEGNPGLWGKAGNYAKNWWNLAAHGEDEQGQQVPLVNRISGSVLGPLGDVADLTLGGGAVLNALSPGNPQGGWIKNWFMPALNAAGSAGGNLVGQAAAGNPTTDWESLYQAARKGLNNQTSPWQQVSDLYPQMPNTAGTFAHGLENTVHDPNFIGAMDLATALPLGEELAGTAFKPMFKGSGAALRYLTDKGAGIADNVVANTAEVNPQFSKNLAKGNNFFKALTNATPEYRQRMEEYNKNASAFSQSKQQLARVNSIATAITNKMRAEGLDTQGDFLQGHWQGEGDTVPGNLVHQAILHGVEAGDEGSLFAHKDEVINQAGKFGIPIKALSTAIDEMKTEGLRSGQAMVAAGLMDQKTFDQHAGYFVRRFYATNTSDPAQAQQLVRDLVAKGIDSTKANNIVMRLQQVGEQGPPEVTGTGLKTRGTTAKNYERGIETASDRLDLRPDYTNIAGTGARLLQQQKAAWLHKTLGQWADDPTASVANKVINHGSGLDLQLSQTPRILSMQNRIGEAVKKHQEYLSSQLEPRYNSLHKWVSDQENTASRSMADLAEHQGKRPVQPVSPNAPPESLTRGALDVGSGVAVKKPSASAIADTITAKKASDQYVKDMADWQNKEVAWKKKNATLEDNLQSSQAELARRQGFLDQSTAAVDEWFDKAERLQRRSELLEGRLPSDADANDALSAMEKELGVQVTDPAEREGFYYAWKNAWRSHGIDIFDDEYWRGAKAPSGIHQKTMELINNNITPAIAIDPTLSAANIAGAKPGWTLWDSKGEERYGPMEGRWGNEAVRLFLEDAIDPNRFGRQVHPVLKFLETYSRLMREMKTAYNPALTNRIKFSRFWEAKAVVNAAGKTFDPVKYFRSMRQMKEYASGKSDVITPAVKATLENVREMGAGYMTSSPWNEMQPGEETGFQRWRSARRQYFIDIHQLPKAGVVGNLISQGIDPAIAGQIADVGMGARGGNMGGIETHGVANIVEGLNRYGMAIFTSYPLHSINMFFRLMSEQPQAVMRYPIIRQYLLKAQGQSVEGRADRDEVTPVMIPIPAIKNSRGEPIWVDARMVIPFSGATEPYSFPGLLSSANKIIKQDQFNPKTGAAPDLQGNNTAWSLWKEYAPPPVGTMLEALGHTVSGTPANPNALEVQSPLMMLGQEMGVASKFPQNSVDQAFWLNRDTIPEREASMTTYFQKVTDGKVTPRDYSTWTDKMNLDQATQALNASGRYLGQLLRDKSMSSAGAAPMIERQIDWRIALGKVATRQQNLALQQYQGEEGYGSEEYSQESNAAYGQ